MNRYTDGTYTYYDLSFDENDQNLLRLGGVIFNGDPSEQEIKDRIYEIISFNLADYELKNIIII